MKGILKVVMAVAIMALLASPSLADDTETFGISATIDTMSQLDVTISRVDNATGDWTTASSVDFGTLTWDSTYDVFRADCYYAVDVGIVDNSGSWTLTHTGGFITNGTDFLDDNINVVFMNQIDDLNATELDKLSYTNAKGKILYPADITGWLRIYYGVGTGDVDDAPGVTPIGLDKSPGTYTGTITLTLTAV